MIGRNKRLILHPITTDEPVQLEGKTLRYDSADIVLIRFEAIGKYSFLR